MCVFLRVSDEGPYTKHSTGSRTPDGALAIRRQSIPGNAHIYYALMVQFVLSFVIYPFLSVPISFGSVLCDSTSRANKHTDEDKSSENRTHPNTG